MFMFFVIAGFFSRQSYGSKGGKRCEEKCNQNSWPATNSPQQLSFELHMYCLHAQGHLNHHGWQPLTCCNMRPEAWPAKLAGAICKCTMRSVAAFAFNCCMLQYCSSKPPAESRAPVPVLDSSLLCVNASAVCNCAACIVITIVHHTCYTITPLGQLLLLAFCPCSLTLTRLLLPAHALFHSPDSCLIAHCGSWCRPWCTPVCFPQS